MSCTPSKTGKLGLSRRGSSLISVPQELESIIADLLMTHWLSLSRVLLPSGLLPSGSYWRVEIQIFRLPVFSSVLAETRGDQVKEMPRTPFPGFSRPCRLSFGWLTELSNANGPSPSSLISDILFNQLFKTLSIFLSALA